MNSAKDNLLHWTQTRNNLLDAIEQIDVESFIQSPAGGWSASEICHHLYLTQYGYARTIPIVLSGKFGDAVPSDYNPPYDKISEAFEKPKGIQNPKPVSPENVHSKEEIQNLLKKSQQLLEKNFQKYDENALLSRGYVHPLIGFLSISDWMWTLSQHEKMHLDVMKIKYQL